jgi:cell division protein FtsW (lipid II flippase)
VIAHDDPVPRAAGGSALVDEAEPEAQARRRLPIVKSLVALLLIVIIGAGYAAWRYTQTQYYVGEDAGHVAIFRGVNQNVAGLKLSRLHQRTEIPLAAVPVTDQTSIRSTISATSLASAQAIVGTIRGEPGRLRVAPGLPAEAERLHQGAGRLQEEAPPDHRRAGKEQGRQGGRHPAAQARRYPAHHPPGMPRTQRGSGDRDSAVSVVATPGQPGDPARTGPMRAPLYAAQQDRVPMPRGRRRTELAMLVFAVAVVLFAYASVGLSMTGRIPAGILGYGLAFALLMLLAHLAIRWLAPWADPLMLPLAALLNGLGIVMIYRLQQSGRDGNAGRVISTMSTSSTVFQVIWSTVGVAAFIAVLALVREPRTLQRYTYTLGAVGLALLAIPALLPASLSEVNGAKVWISIGGFSVQPGEFAKLALAVFFAGYLVAKRDVLSLAGRRFLGIDLPRARDLGPVLIAWGASLLILIFETDIGTSALFFGMFLVMLYVATQRTSWLLIGGLLFVSGAYLASKLFAHVGERVNIWLHPFAAQNIYHSSYQLVQGLYGMGYGGVLGTGLGNGQPYWTPLVQSDFIFTAFGEELGLTGLMAILLIYGLIVQRGLRAAVAVRDPFSKLLAAGLSFVLALQVFVIVGGVTRLIPLTGITTPFLSQGGSSLVASWMLIALLMRISDAARRPAPQPIQEEGMTQVVRGG